MNGDEARRLGEKLLAEVEVMDLSSVIKALHVLNIHNGQSDSEGITRQTSHFGIPELDALIPTSKPPVLELVSPPSTHQPSGSGKTSLLYLIIAIAILPRTLSGHESAIILFDPLHHFNIARLAEITLHVIKARLQATSTTTPTHQTIKSTIKSAFQHVHIFHPPSWPSLISSLRSLPTYLFASPQTTTTHHSTHRRIHSLILEDIDALIPSLRNTNTTNTTNISTSSSTLTSQLTHLSTLLSCATILTSRSTTPRYYRPQLPISWGRDVPLTRLALRRVDVRPFAAGLSIDEAEAEREKRWEVASRARFECWKVGLGAPAAAAAAAVQGVSGNRNGNGGFVFSIGKKGIEIEIETDMAK